MSMYKLRQIKVKHKMFEDDLALLTAELHILWNWVIVRLSPRRRAAMKEIFMFISALDRARRSRRQENAGMKYDPRLQDFVKTTRTGHTMQCY